MPVIPTPALRTRRHRYLKHFSQHQTGYLVVKLPPRIITDLKQVSMPAGLRRIVRSKASSVNDLPSFRSEPETERLTLCALISICCAFTAVPAFAQADLAGATTKLTLQVATAMPGEKCRRIEAPDPASLASVSLHRTFEGVGFVDGESPRPSPSRSTGYPPTRSTNADRR
jgi:hypothetical protein